jgi:hypothetical protein
VSRAEDAMDGGALLLGEVIPGVSETSRAEAAILLAAELRTLDGMRARIAHAYAFAPGDSSIEHELGESLTVVRKALKRMREAWSELAQMQLPMEAPKRLRPVGGGPLN